MPAVTVNDLNNAQLDVNTIASVATSTAATVTDRLGNVKNTMSGNNAAEVTARSLRDSTEAIALSKRGYEVPVAYVTGISLTRASQTVSNAGTVYAPNLADLPFTTSGTFEATKFKVIQGGDSSSVLHRGSTVFAAINRAERIDRVWLNSRRRLESTMDSFMSLSAIDAPLISFAQFEPDGTTSNVLGEILEVDSITWSTVGADHVATVTTALAHKFDIGKTVLVAGSVQPEFNGVRTITITGFRTFTFLIGPSAFPASRATGTITCSQTPIFTRSTEAVFTYSHGRKMMVAEASYSYLNGFTALTSTTPTYAVEFVCNDDTFEFLTRTAPGGGRIFVNGYPVVNLDISGSSYPPYAVKLVFPSVRQRTIRLELLATCSFVGITTRKVQNLFPVGNSKPALRCLMLSDSFGEGTGSKGYFNSVTSYIGAKMGWEMINGSLGSTGIGTNGVQAAGRDYLGRLCAEYAKYQPDIVLVWGSVNGAVDTTNAGVLFDAVGSVMPNAKVIAFGPISPTESPLPSLVTQAGLLRTQAQARGIPYLDGGIGLDGGALWITSGNKQAYYTGTTATGTAALTANAVTSIAVVNAGEGYDFHTSVPTVTFSGGGGSGAAGVAVMDYRVYDLVLLKGGSNYSSAPTVTIGGGAAGFPTLNGTSVRAVNVTDEGDGYIVPPSVLFSGGGGSGAAATAVIQGGRVVRVDLSSAGSSYSSPPTISFASNSSDATAAATVSGGKVTGLTLTSSGSFFTSCPRVTFSGGGAGAGGAEAVAYLSGKVSSYTVTYGGTGYSSAPSVSLPNPTLSDVTHPKETGHQMLAARVSAQLASL